MDILGAVSSTDNVFGIRSKSHGAMTPANRTRSMKLLVIVDIDGTLANISEAAKQAGFEPSRSDRGIYSAWVKMVTANLHSAPTYPAVIEAVRAMFRGNAEIVYLTSREEVHRDVTQTWLNKNAAPGGKLLMRGFDDWRSTADVKKSFLISLVNTHQGPIVAIDDDATNEVTPIYKALGISHLKVQDGLDAWEQT